MTSPVGLHRVLEPAGTLPQGAWRLDTRPEIGPDEVRIRVERLNLDAASFRQLSEKHGGDGDAVRRGGHGDADRQPVGLGAVGEAQRRAIGGEAAGDRPVRYEAQCRVEVERSLRFDREAVGGHRRLS